LRYRSEMLFLVLGFCLFLSSHLGALDSDELLFYLSFDNGVKPDFARGDAALKTRPTDLDNRLVEGVIGRGYRFGGKGSTLQFSAGGGGPRACQQMYGPKVNIFKEEGTVAFWIKPLANQHNMVHVYFRTRPTLTLDMNRNQYMHNWFSIGPYPMRGQAVIYDARMPDDKWVHFAVSWRADKGVSFYNGHRSSSVSNFELRDFAEFVVAREGMTWLDFQEKKFQDDMVMDEFMIFSRALAEGEVRALFERGHVETREQVGNIRDGLITKPERPFAPTVLVAPQIKRPIKPDGSMRDWLSAARQAGFVERRLGVLDADDGKVFLACDDTNLYLGFSVDVPKSVRDDPMHILYPGGVFKAGTHNRDDDVFNDDYIEFQLKGADGADYSFALNVKGVLRDARNGDAQWNGEVAWNSRADFKTWTAELAVPLSILGAKIGDEVGFNVRRGWKWHRSSENTLAVDEQAQPAYGTLMLGGPAASLISLGEPAKGAVEVKGFIHSREKGSFKISVKGKGFKKEMTVKGQGRIPFAAALQLEEPGDDALVVQVADAEENLLLSRTAPFVFVPASSVNLIEYPGAGVLEVSIAPLKRTGDTRAEVALLDGSTKLMEKAIKSFDEPAKVVSFNTKELKAGKYAVQTRLYEGHRLISQDRKDYVKEPLPEWFKSTVGIIDTPPVPWTPPAVEGKSVRLLLKKITFGKTLYPGRIVSNGQNLLAGPLRFRVMRAGEEKVITSGSMRFVEKTAREARWEAEAVDGALKITVKGSIEFDGFTWTDVTFSGGRVDKLDLEIPLDAKTCTLRTLKKGIIDDEVIKTVYSGYWFGNEKAGLQYWWEDQRGWVRSGSPVTFIPGNREHVISLHLFAKPVELKEPRTISWGYAITPTKPIPKEWRLWDRYGYWLVTGDYKYRSFTYSNGDYAVATPNYPKPRSTPEQYAKMEQDSRRRNRTVMWYGFGTQQWIGSPEYAKWWREWRPVPSTILPPDPKSTAWAMTCPRSSASNMYLWRLARFVKKYPQHAVYYDCMGMPSCKNTYHGCGYIDDEGRRQPSHPKRDERRHYERVYNILRAKAKIPVSWIRFHDWGPDLMRGAFCDENWTGEGLIGPIGGTPEKNYYRVVDLPFCRIEYRGEQWGHLQNWLTELACSAGDSKEKRAGWYGKMIEPPKDGKPGKWIIPQMPSYDHVAGLGFIHDSWTIGGNDLAMIGLNRLSLVQEEFGWGTDIEFIGYWELGDALGMEGGVPEKIVCSIYYKPARKDKTGAILLKPKLMLVPMNNTDKDVTVTLLPNLKKFGLEELKDGVLWDAYRGIGCTIKMPKSWRANAGDPEAPTFVFNSERIVYRMKDGGAEVDLPKRNFRALILDAEVPDLEKISAKYPGAEHDSF